MLHRFLFLLVLFLSVRPTFGQTLDPYRRINDPLAIADLGGPDSGELTQEYFASTPLGGIDTDGFSILASDSGSGVIRHLWATFVNNSLPSDSTLRMRLWINDSLAIDTLATDFFRHPHGLIRPPFDSIASGGYDMETQIPYTHGFKWTMNNEWLWYSAEWQRLNGAILPRFGSTEYQNFQTLAEGNYFNDGSQSDGEVIERNQNLASGSTDTIADISGSAYIQSIEFPWQSWNLEVLRNLWMEIHWDNAPSASVLVPLSDFFTITPGIRNVRSLWIYVDSVSKILRCTFPMPFYSHATITLTNGSQQPYDIESQVRYQPATWNPEWGYFGAQLGVTPQIPYHVLHQVAHLKGRGRYVGTILMFPDYKVQNFLEGDAYFVVDSLPYGAPYGQSIHYAGTEDYIGGGWYFIDSIFSLPFRGCPNLYGSMYRFHVNDCINFNKSLDVQFGHGFNDDLTLTYRSIAFYYQQWTPFYPSSDTLIAGNTWRIIGAGFAPNTQITAVLGSDTIYKGHSASDGTISLTIPVNSNWEVGNFQLSINGITKPEWITVLAAPKIVYLTDSLQPVFGERDSIDIRAYGFHANEELTLLLGDTLFDRTPHIIADSDGVVRIKTFLPWVPEGTYFLNVLRSDGSTIRSDSSIFVTRTLDYEFELLSATGPPYGTPQYAYVSYPDWHLSQGAFAFCYGNSTKGSTFTFQFSVPFTDSFATTVFALRGNRYAIYRTSIDGNDLGTHDWFWNVPFPAIMRDSVVLSNVYLTAGMHTMTCVNEGWDDSTVEYSYGPDNFLLRPLSAQSGSQETVNPIAASAISIFPNPLDEPIAFISGIPDSFGTIEASLYNEIGVLLFRSSLPSQTGIRSISIPPLANGSYWLSLELPDEIRMLPIRILR